MRYPVINFTVPLTFDISVQVSGSYSPATPDVLYLRNGDPGHPGDPAEFELDSVTLSGSQEDISEILDAFYVDKIRTYVIENFDWRDA